MFRNKSSAGQTVIEVLVAIGISAIMLPALATAVIASREGRTQSTQRFTATTLMQEAEEAVLTIKNTNWTSISTNGTYYPTISGSTWGLATGSEIIGNFVREIEISDSERDSNGNIVQSGGQTDPSTKTIKITVSWSTPFASSVSDTLYLSRWRNNTTWSQTTQAEFNGATSLQNTVTTNNNGGEVELAPGPADTDWSTPEVFGGANTTGTTDGVDIYTAGNYAYIITGNIFNIFDISLPTSPVFLGSYDAGGAVNQVSVSGSFAYLATTLNNAELIVLNISNPLSPSLASTINLSGTTDALSIFTSGNYAYIGRASSTSSEFQIINITNPSSPSLNGALDHSDSVNDIVVSGNYAYLATNSNTQELLVVNITNPSTPTTAGSYDSPGTVDALDLDIDLVNNPNTLYLTRLRNNQGQELYSVNISNPTTPAELNGFEVNSDVYGVTADSDLAFIGTVRNGRQFIIIDVSTPSNMSEFGRNNYGSTINAVKAHSGYVYGATVNDSQELVVFGPSATGASKGYVQIGAIESSTFDAGINVGFNYLSFASSEPANTDIQFQIATNSDDSTWLFVGPDGTNSTFYSGAGDLPLDAVSGRYFRFKAFFSGDGTVSPVLEDVTLNYSP